MPNYIYKAVNSKGIKFTDKIKYETEKDVLNYLKSKNLMPIEIKTVSTLNMDLTEFKIFKPKVGLKDLSIFCRQFATIIQSGISISTALEILQYQIENPTLKSMIHGVDGATQKGNLLSEAMSVYREFPVLMVRMIEVGELSGKLDLSLNQLAKQYDKDLATERKIKSAMTYPAIVTVLMLAVIIIVVAFVVPSYMSMFAEMDVELPNITLVLMAVSDFIINRWYLIFGIIIISIIVLKLLVNTTKGKYIFDSIMLKIPVVGKLIVRISTVRFSRTMSVLLSSGVPILEALEIIRKVITNVVIQTAIENAILDVKQGKTLDEPIKACNLFPYMLSSMLKIGGETGSLDNVLYKTADFYDEEVATQIEKLTTFIEPIITIIIAVVMGFVMLAILMPTFSLATQM